MDDRRISLGYRPRGARRVRILGVRPSLGEYPAEDRRAIENADRILYPTRLYAEPLTAAGKTVFPSPRDYHFAGDKIRQCRLFAALNLPAPRTGIYYGRRAAAALDHFRYPFVAKIPRGVGRGLGVFLIRNQDEYQGYLARTREALVQEYLPLEKDLRVVVVRGRVVTAYRRHAAPGEFRANLHQGGRLDFSDVPPEGIAFAETAVRCCGFDDVGLDVCLARGNWFILEANMHYGLEGLAAAGICLADVIDRLIEEGRI